MHRLAHVSSHVFDAAEKRGYRVQSHAGTVAAFNSAIHVGCVFAGSHARQTCSSGSSLVVGVFVRSERNVTTVCIGSRCSVRARANRLERKGTPKRARKRALLGPRWFQRNPRNSFGMNGGDDETRTRDLCRDGQDRAIRGSGGGKERQLRKSSFAPIPHATRHVPVFQFENDAAVELTHEISFVCFGST
jgi:hypothetical protein